MARRIESHSIEGPAGRLEALLEEPEDQTPLAAAVLCHPHPLYGGTMHNKVVYRMAHGLRKAGLVVLRFNFRGVGRSDGEHANLVGEIEDARAALAWVRGHYLDLPFALAGFSFGARVTVNLGCAMEDARFLMVAGLPTRLGDGAVLETCGVPKIFVQSTQDQFGPREEMEALYARVAEPKRLIWVESEDHFFKGALEELEGRVYEAAGEALRSETTLWPSDGEQ